MSRASTLFAAIAVGLVTLVALRMRSARDAAPETAAEPAKSMDEERLWQILAPLKSLPLEAREARLRHDLHELSEEDISAFARHYERAMDHAYTWELWGAAYVVMQGCSDDGFTEFRNWLISEGHEVYKAVLAEPDRLAEITRIPKAPEEEPELGDWPMLSGLDLIPFELLGAFDSPSPGDTQRLNEITADWESGPTEPAGKPWEDSPEVLAERYPRLWKLYGHGGERRR